MEKELLQSILELGGKGLLLYLLGINILCFLSFAYDKWQAIHKGWRVPEKVLLGQSFLGGALGGILGMYLCRHKTRKPRFLVLMPVGLLLWITLFFGRK